MALKFSERLGIVEPRKVFQKDSIDDALKNSLWNVYYAHYLAHMNMFNPLDEDRFYNYALNLYKNHLKLTVDSLPYIGSSFVQDIKLKFFVSFKWYDIYDFLEFTIKNPGELPYKTTFIKQLNDALETEMSAYRIVGTEFVEITSEGEIKEIEDALENTRKLSGVKAHLNSALSLLADKINPDYRNSIKESISAVESLCKIIAGDPKATLGAALNMLEKQGFEIHGALKDGFSKLYGYTSDGDGIRHSMLDESIISQEDARYWLISCSAFINYLIAKVEKSGIDVS